PARRSGIQSLQHPAIRRRTPRLVLHRQSRCRSHGLAQADRRANGYGSGQGAGRRYTVDESLGSSGLTDSTFFTGERSRFFHRSISRPQRAANIQRNDMATPSAADLKRGFVTDRGLLDDNQFDQAAEVLAAIEASGLETVRLAFVDQHGVL